MATLSELQVQLSKLQTARGSGVLSVTDGGKRVEYRTMADLTAAINQVVADIARLTASQGGVVPSRTMRSIVSKGT